MRLIGYLFVGCIALAVLRVAFQTVAVAALALLLWLAVTRPRETGAFICIFIFVGWVNQHPVLGLTALGLLAPAGLLGRPTGSG